MPDDSFSPAIRAQILATEHWSLLATRSQTWSEVMGRITAQFTFASASLVVLALAVQGMGNGSDFRLLALGLGLAVLLTGTLTAVRVSNASQEDYFLVKGMNRLRAAYLDLDPGIRPYLVTGSTDDVAGVGATYTMGVPRVASQLLASANIFITTVNAIVAGGVAGLLAWTLGGTFTILIALGTALTYIAAFGVAGARQFRFTNDPKLTRFPSAD